MPIYEYECNDCALKFEVKRRFGENSGSCCPRCHSDARRVFSTVPIIFKGPGFYVTDNASRASGTLDKKRNGDGSKGEAKREVLSDYKGEAKCETSSVDKKVETIS